MLRLWSGDAFQLLPSTHLYSNSRLSILEPAQHSLGCHGLSEQKIYLPIYVVSLRLSYLLLPFSLSPSR